MMYSEIIETRLPYRVRRSDDDRLPTSSIVDSDALEAIAKRKITPI